jgi:hypothetical protein
MDPTDDELYIVKVLSEYTSREIAESISPVKRVQVFERKLHKPISAVSLDGEEDEQHSGSELCRRNVTVVK